MEEIQKIPEKSGQERKSCAVSLTALSSYLGITITQLLTLCCLYRKFID